MYHRDLKDDNLFVFLDGGGGLISVKIGDVGEAKVRALVTLS